MNIQKEEGGGGVLVRYISDHRHQPTERAFQQHGVDFQYHQPVNGRVEMKERPGLITPVNHLRLNSRRPRQSHEDFDTFGGIGCSFSHIQLWEEAVHSKYGMLILERRAYTTVDVLDPSLIPFLQSCGENGTDFVSIVRIDMGVYVHSPWLIFRQKKTLHPLDDLNILIGLQAYWVSPRGAKRLLENAFPIDKHLDAYIHYVSTKYNNEFTFTMYDYGIGCNRMMKSTIKHGGSWLQTVPPTVAERCVILLLGVILTLAVLLILKKR